MIPVNRQIIQHARVVKDTEKTIKKWVAAEDWDGTNPIRTA